MPLTEREKEALRTALRDAPDVSTYDAEVSALAPVVEAIVALRCREAFRQGVVLEIVSEHEIAALYPLPIHPVKVPREPLKDGEGYEWTARNCELLLRLPARHEWMIVNGGWPITPKRAAIWHRLFTEPEYVEKEEPCDFGLLEEK